MGLLCLMKKVSAYKYRNEQAIRVKFLNVTVYGCILTYSVVIILNWKMTCQIEVIHSTPLIASSNKFM